MEKILKKELEIKKDRLERVWRKILYPHGLAPPYSEKKLPLLLQVIAKEKGIEEIDPYILINSYEIKIEGKYEILVREKIEKLHQLGILHGDLHNRNIVWYQNEPVFIDFEYTCYIDQLSENDIFWYLEFLGYNGESLGDLLKGEITSFSF